MSLSSSSCSLSCLPAALIARVPLKKFGKAVKEPALIAFSTTSSEAALPKAMLAMQSIGVPKRIVAFVMPTGYSFNLDGTTLYLAVASVFAAQAAEHPPDLGPAARDDAHAHAHEQRSRGGPAGVAGGPGRHAGVVRTCRWRPWP